MREKNDVGIDSDDSCVNNSTIERTMASIMQRLLDYFPIFLKLIQLKVDVT